MVNVGGAEGTIGAYHRRGTGSGVGRVVVRRRGGMHAFRV